MAKRGTEPTVSMRIGADRIRASGKPVSLFALPRLRGFPNTTVINPISDLQAIALTIKGMTGGMFGCIIAQNHLQRVRTKARELELESIVRLNALVPGEIYREDRILTEIQRQTHLAASGATKSEIKQAAAWLKRACVPRQRYSREVRQLTIECCGLYALAYVDVVAIRRALQMVRRGSVSDSGDRSTKALDLFPSLEKVADDIMGVACGIVHKKGDAKMVPVRAAAHAVGKVTGLEERTVRNEMKILLDWPELRPQLESLGKFLGTVAAVRGDRMKYKDTDQIRLQIPTLVDGRELAEHILGFALEKNSAEEAEKRRIQEQLIKDHFGDDWRMMKQSDSDVVMM